MTAAIARLAVSRLEAAITAYAVCERSEITESASRLRRERARFERLRAALGTEAFETALADRKAAENQRKPFTDKAKVRTWKRTRQGVML